MLLGQDGYLVAEKIPVTSSLAQSNNGDEESGCRGKVGSLLFAISEDWILQASLAKGDCCLPVVFASREERAAR